MNYFKVIAFFGLGALISGPTGIAKSDTIGSYVGANPSLMDGGITNLQGTVQARLKLVEIQDMSFSARPFVSFGDGPVSGGASITADIPSTAFPASLLKTVGLAREGNANVYAGPGYGVLPTISSKPQVLLTIGAELEVGSIVSYMDVTFPTQAEGMTPVYRVGASLFRF